MNKKPNPDVQEGVMGLNATEMDTIGEILNISMGAAATAVSILLSRQVTITAPNVNVVHSSAFEFSRLEPACGIEIKYIGGLHGSNHMIMRVVDVKAIVQLLLGDEQGEDLGIGLDEIHISALGEVMNQMMGASCTALASFLDRNIDISPPTPFEISDISQKLLDAKQQDYIVTVGFKLMIEGLVDSEFVTVMPVPFAKELVKNAMVEAGAIEVQSEMQSEVQREVQPEVKKEEQTIPQVTGHTQIPAPVHEGDFQPPQPKPAPAPRPAPAPAPAPVYAPPPTPAPAAGYSAPKMPPPKDVVVKPLQFGSFDSGEAASEEMDQVNLGLVMGVDLNVTVEIGRTKKQVKEILSLRQGSIVELDKQAGDPVDIVVNGKLIARGDVVVIDDNFGVRVTEIVNSKSKSRW